MNGEVMLGTCPAPAKSTPPYGGSHVGLRQLNTHHTREFTNQPLISPVAFSNDDDWQPSCYARLGGLVIAFIARVRHRRIIPVPSTPPLTLPPPPTPAQTQQQNQWKPPPLVAVATQIAALLTRFVSAAHQAPAAIAFLTSEVTTFTHVLTTIPTLALPSLDTHRSVALAAARTTLTELQTELTRMTAGGGARFWERVRYASGERALAALVDRLCCHKLTLLLCLNVLARSDNAGCNDATRRGVAELTQQSASAPPPGSAGPGASSSSLALAAYPSQPAATGAGTSAATAPAPGYTPFYYSVAQPYYTYTPFPGASPSSASYFPYNYNSNYTPTPPAATQTAPYLNYYRFAFPLTPSLFNPSYSYLNPYSNPYTHSYPTPQQPPQYPLHAAIDRRDTYTLSYLLAQRHSTCTTHPSYGPPLAHAVLLLWGADVSARSQSGKSLLHFAAELGDEAVVGYLLAMGAAVGDLDGGNTPLAVATGEGWGGVVGMLRAWGAAA
ncbi:hypothetical protein DFP73DRAFT_600621 [Morchella snyderi]|nr:hypothetical protein DFP73DRAFT_600621 [Morchella snyderi]